MNEPRTYNQLKAISVRKTVFKTGGIPVTTDDDEVVILYNNNKITKEEIRENISAGQTDFFSKVLCVNKKLAEQLAD